MDIDELEYESSKEDFEKKLELIRETYPVEVDEETGQEIVGGVICIEDVDWL